MKKHNDKKNQRFKINDQIEHKTIRLIFNDESKVMCIEDAIKIANDKNLDLILINDKQNPPIVRLDDYGKFLYNLEKKNKEKNKKNKNITKTIKFSTNIAENDLKIKSQKALKMLKEGNTIRLVLEMVGREKMYIENGENVLLKFMLMLGDNYIIEKMPAFDGNKWISIIKPIKK